MDDETRYLIAQEVADTKYKHDARGIFHKGKQIVDKKPEALITDGLPSYSEAFNRVLHEHKTKDRTYQHN